MARMTFRHPDEPSRKISTQQIDNKWKRRFKITLAVAIIEAVAITLAIYLKYYN
jgi:hypothetical protein